MNPRDFHVLAAELAAGRISGRMSVGDQPRYYAAFHVGAELLRALGFRISRGAAGHGEVARCFDNSAVAETMTTGESSSDLHTSQSCRLSPRPHRC